MKHHKFVIALTGKIGAGVECLQQDGISAVFGIIDQNSTDQELFAKAHTNISRTSENIMRLIYFKHNNEAIT
jgi:glycerate kinase